MTRYKLLILLMLFAGMAGQAFAGDPVVKTIERSFPLSANGQLEIKNTYGKVDIQSWNQARTEITVTITVKSRSDQKAREIMEMIAIQFDHSGDRVKAETILKRGGSWWSSGQWKNVEFSIDYQVRMPASAMLDLTNKYGNLYIDQLTGKAVIRLAYGHLQIGTLSGDTQLTMDYSKGSIGNLGDGRLYLSYSQLKCQNGDNLEVDSKYSQLDMANAARLRFHSKYDQLRLQQVNELEIDGKYDEVTIERTDVCKIHAAYTNVEIDELGKGLRADLDYGNLAVREVAPRFHEVTLHTRYTDVKLWMNRSASYQLDARAQYTGIQVPSGFTDTERRKDGANMRLAGHQGNRNGGVIKADIQYGSFKIQ